MVKNPNRQEADQLAIYKRSRRVELGATKKQLLLTVRAGLKPVASGLQVRRPNPLDHAAYYGLLIHSLIDEVTPFTASSIFLLRMTTCFMSASKLETWWIFVDDKLSQSRK